MKSSPFKANYYDCSLYTYENHYKLGLIDNVLKYVREGTTSKLNTRKWFESITGFRKTSKGRHLSNQNCIMLFFLVGR